MNKSIRNVLNANINKNHFVLDVGCGNKEYSSGLECGRVVTIDAWNKVRPNVLVDLETCDLPFKSNSFDVILMLDFIEHLPKERGCQILNQAKEVTKNKIILLTPLWWQDNSENVNNPNLWCYGNIYDYHKSLWTLADFEGWDRIMGINDEYFIGVWQK